MLEPGDYFSHRTLGTTGLRVTPLCIGTAALGDMPEAFAYSVPEDEALAAVRATLDSAINFIDTAASYGDGESERRIGVVLRERGGIPEGYVIGTKADRDMNAQVLDQPLGLQVQQRLQWTARRRDGVVGRVLRVVQMHQLQAVQAQ